MMEDTSYWAKYAEGIDGVVATGGPTLSYQFKNSCMEKYSEIEEITYSLKNTRAYEDSLYFPHTEEYQECNGYYLAEMGQEPPSITGTISVASNGEISMYNSTDMGICPLVCMPSDVIAQKVAGIWQIVVEE